MLEMDSPDGWDEQEIESQGGEGAAPEEPSGPLEPPPSSGRGRSPWLIGIVVAVVLMLFGVYYFTSMRPSPPAEPQPEVASLAPDLPEPAELDNTVAPVALPALHDSDGFVRTLITNLLDHPKLAVWLAEQELVRRFVASVDNIARGESPASNLVFLRPEEPFTEVRRGGRSFISSASYERYDAIAEVVSSASAEDAFEIYRTLTPLLDLAYAELGSGKGNFEPVLIRAIEEILAVPVLDNDQIALVPRFKSYHYADSSLESLSDAQKLFLRMGPSNLRKVQAKLRDFRARMGQL